MECENGLCKLDFGPLEREIETRIRSALIMDPSIGREDWDVNFNSGVVTITGTVNSSWKRELAGMIAHDIKGVFCVTNKLRINRASSQATAHSYEVCQLRSLGKELQSRLCTTGGVANSDIVLEFAA
jgi:hypothetical protein